VKNSQNQFPAQLSLPYASSAIKSKYGSETFYYERQKASAMQNGLNILDISAKLLSFHRVTKKNLRNIRAQFNIDA